jgi:hypothetical protein
MTGTEMSRDTPGAVSQMYTSPELLPNGMLAEFTVTFT